jgi:hypothetical protein
MNMTKQLLNTKNLKLAQAKETAEKLENTYSFARRMITVQNPDWENKSIKENEEIMQNNKKYLAYTNLIVACSNLSYAERRGKNMLRELENAINYAEEIGANIY